MAKVKVTGINKAKSNMQKVIDDVKQKKALRAIHSALIIIGTESATMVPIDTSNLINSQFRDVNTSGTRVYGKVGYSAEYAAYVHEMSGKLKGKPRSSVASFETGDGRIAFASNKGNFWDPGGEPGFLDKAVKRTKKQCDDVIKKEMSL
ncbi:TPA: HK97 gp10 family phage protein [Yersinia enterocolitica]|nr:HK97 gp10 family phage protein [Yersinia enterocolitica]